MAHVTRDKNGKIKTINKLPREGREELPDDHPDILAVRQRQQEARDEAIAAAPAGLLARVIALEAEVDALKKKEAPERPTS